MSEILLSEDGETTTTLPISAEEKARQLPDPSTFYLLCALPEVEEKFDNGLVKAGTTMHYEKHWR